MKTDATTLRSVWLIAVTCMSLVAAPPAVASESEEEAGRPFDEVLSAWNEWEAKASRLPVSEGTTEFVRGPTKTSNGASRYEFGIDGDYYYSRVRGAGPPSAKFEQVVIWNPRYRATISRPESSREWRIKAMFRRGDASGKDNRDVGRGDPIDTTIRSVPTIRKALGEKLYRITRTSHRRDEKSGYDLHHYFLELQMDRIAPNVSQDMQQSVEIVVAEQLDWLPVRFVITQRMRFDGQWREDTSIYTIEEWKKDRGVWHWGRYVMRADDERAGVITSTWSIPSDAKPLDHDLCFLSHYGLPEPEFEGESRWRNWIWLAAGLTLVAGAVIYFTRRR